jgi:hypothetical protein
MPVVPSVEPRLFEPGTISFEGRLIRAVMDIRRGHPVILVGDFDRENEADLPLNWSDGESDATPDQQPSKVCSARGRRNRGCSTAGPVHRACKRERNARVSCLC